MCGKEESAGTGLNPKGLHDLRVAPLQRLIEGVVYFEDVLAVIQKPFPFGGMNSLRSPLVGLQTIEPSAHQAEAASDLRLKTRDIKSESRKQDPTLQPETDSAQN